VNAMFLYVKILSISPIRNYNSLFFSHLIRCNRDVFVRTSTLLQSVFGRLVEKNLYLQVMPCFLELPTIAVCFQSKMK